MHHFIQQESTIGTALGLWDTRQFSSVCSPGVKIIENEYSNEIIVSSHTLLLNQMSKLKYKLDTSYE
jgi:hypothetical protein